jgi:hypothetical protein
MRPVDHLKHSTWFSLALATVMSWPSVAVVFLSSLLIDIDHWLWSIWALGHWNPLTAVRWHREKMADLSNLNYHICCVFHTLEFLSVLGAVAIFSPFARLVLLGFLFHMACDLFCDFILCQETSINFKVKYLLTPFLPKLARREIFARPAPTPAQRRHAGPSKPSGPSW